MLSRFLKPQRIGGVLEVHGADLLIAIGADTVGNHTTIGVAELAKTVE